MQDLIKKLDFISIIPIAYYNGEDRYKNVLGGLYQVFMSLCWIFGIVYFSKEIYLRENPSIVYSTEYDRMPSERSYKNREDFLVMISINDWLTWAPFIDETIYEPKFIMLSKFNQTRGPATPLKAVICSEVLKGYEKHTVGIPTDKYYCLDPKHDEVTFKGTQTSPDSKFMKIGLHMCTNSTANNNHCKTQAVIDEKLQGSSFNLFFFNFKFENKNYENIRETFLDFHHSFYSNLYYKLVFVTLKQIEYIDDVGFLFEDLNKRDYYSVDNIKEVFNFSKQPDRKFLDFAINFGTGKDKIRRQYKRIQSVIAEVGGLFKGIIISSMLLKWFFMGNDVFNYLNYFQNNKEISNNEVISKNFKSKSAIRPDAKYLQELSEANNIKPQKDNCNLIMNNQNSINNNTINNNNNPISKNINSLYSDWKPLNKMKIQENNEINSIQNNLSAKEIKKLNIQLTTNYENKISNELKFIVMNYLDQKEFLKTVLDLNLIKKILFDDSQLLKFEEMSRDMNFMLDILKDKEIITHEVFTKYSKG